MSSSSSYTMKRFCFNRECSDFKLDRYRSGWRLRTGDFADLCDRCASAYEQGKFCDIFHLRAHGWRCCESCGKRLHCGCIVSESTFLLLDAGGIECLDCARRKVPLGSNFAQPQSYFLQSPFAEKFRDLSMNWSSSTRSHQISCQSPHFVNPSVLQYDLHNHGDRYGFNQPTSKDRGMMDLMGNVMSENSQNHTMDLLINQKAGPNFKVPPFPKVNVYHPLISLKEGIAFPAPNTTPIVTNGHSRLDGRNLQHTPNFSSQSPFPYDLNDGADSTLENKSWNLGTNLDTPGKCQVVPQYEVLDKSPDWQKESNSVVIPLFEKMLSASDTGRKGRLVLPKQCAKAFFPQISDYEGVPLKVQDSMGKEWTFQFRLTTRTYILDGVFAWIQSMQLQAGDTVIFKRLDPERKFIMDFRKASVAQSVALTSDQSLQEIDSANNISDTYTNGETEPVDTHSPSNVKKSAYRAKESSTIITRSKRQKIEKGDLIELKLTWKEAQELLLPPPNITPAIVAIEGSEFEEYEVAPIIGKPTVCATTNSRGSTSSADEELIAEEHDEDALENTATRHPRHKNGCPCIVCSQSPSGFGPKHFQGCCCKVCLTTKRRKRSLLLHREKKRTKRAINAQKKLESLNFDEELHQHTSCLKAQIDLNFQPEKDEEYLSASNSSI